MNKKTYKYYSLSRHQLFNVIFFIFWGKLYFHIDISWIEIISACLLSIATESILYYFKNKKIIVKSSSLISALAISVVLRSSNIYIIPLFSVVAIIQKYLFRRSDGRHTFNPSNFAIVTALSIFPSSTHLDLMGWGTNYFLIFFIISSGTLLLKKSKLLVNSSIFILTYSIFFILLVSSSFSSLMTQLTSPTLLLFSFFIINDPQSIPGRKIFLYYKTLFSILLYFILFISLGSKSLNLPISLLISSIIFRGFDQLTNIKVIKPLKIFTPVIITALSILLYFSSYNLVKNLKSAILTRPSTKNQRTATSTLNKKKLTNKVYQSLFKRNDIDFIEASPLTIFRDIKGRSHLKLAENFTRLDNSLSLHNSPSKPEHWGNDFAMYAGIGSIDINNDLLEDIILTYSTGELALFLNLGENKFINISSSAFNFIPKGVEEFKVADLNSDGYEDILIVFKQLNSKKNNGIYFFSPVTKKFTFKKIDNLGNNKKQAGGIGVYDINEDGYLDFYVSFGLDWDSHDYYQKRYMDEIWINKDGNYWENKSEDYFPNFFKKKPLSGMSVQFTRLFDNKLFLLLGNDLNDDPSLIFKVSQSSLDMVPASTYPLQSADSMSFFSLDINNNGKLEVWENAVQNNNSFKHNSHKRITTKGIATKQYIEEIRSLILQQAHQKFNCSLFKNKFVLNKCQFFIIRSLAKNNNDPKLCEQIKNRADQSECIIMSKSFNIPTFRHPELKNNDIDQFPRVQDGNTLLKIENKLFKPIAGNGFRSTGWAWSSYPFDIDSNGKLDFYISSNLSHFYQGYNHLLLNYSTSNEIILKNESEKYKINFSGEYRGVLITDLDQNCSGEILSNNFLYNPLYIRNNIYSDCIKFNLYYSQENYKAIGAKVNLHLKDGQILTRTVTVGGIWGSSQSKVLIFNLPSGAVVKKASITWPDLSEKTLSNLKINQEYFLFYNDSIRKKFNLIMR